MKMIMNKLFAAALLAHAASAFVAPGAARPSFALKSSPQSSLTGQATPPGPAAPGPAAPAPMARQGGLLNPFIGNIDEDPDFIVYGQTLRTWRFPVPQSASTQVFMNTDGRPLNANIELWIGPDWTPFKISAYSEDGVVRPIRTMIGSKATGHAIAIRNTNPMEFPVSVDVQEAPPGGDLGSVRAELIATRGQARLCQGAGSVFTTPLDPSVEQAIIFLETDGRRLEARVELLQGPNNVKQTFEIETNGGDARPFFAIVETPDSGNTIRIINTAPVEYPFYAWVCEA